MWPAGRTLPRPAIHGRKILFIQQIIFDPVYKHSDIFPGIISIKLKRIRNFAHSKLHFATFKVTTWVNAMKKIFVIKFFATK